MITGNGNDEKLHLYFKRKYNPKIAAKRLHNKISITPPHNKSKINDNLSPTVRGKHVSVECHPVTGG